MKDPVKLLEKYCGSNHKLFEVLLKHSEAVTKKALSIAKRLKDVDEELVYYGAMLHDIGVVYTYIPELNPDGKYPYIAHGYLGRQILEKEGMPRIGLFCERHIGVGITKEDIIKQNLPLPLRDMTPQTLEEKLVAFADKFFSKSPDGVVREKTVEEVLKNLARYGEEKVKTFKEWLKIFGEV